MFDSALPDPRLLGGAFANRWRINRRILDLEAELGRTQYELEVLRDTTAQLLTAILTKMQRSVSPAGTAAEEIRKLADLCDEDREDRADDPITAQIEMMESDNERSLARLDRRFRWFPSGAK